LHSLIEANGLRALSPVFLECVRVDGIGAQLHEATFVSSP
jgi:hypothetical protein